MYKAELCRSCSVTKDTVRYYHKLGLLQPARRSESNGYGIYTTDHQERIRFIKKLQNFGFSLKEIKSAIELEESGELSDDARIFTLKSKLDEIDIKIKELRDYRESLLSALKYLTSRN